MVPPLSKWLNAADRGHGNGEARQSEDAVNRLHIKR